MNILDTLKQLRDDIKEWVTNNLDAVNAKIDEKTIPIDNELSSTSTNPVQNQAIAKEIESINDRVGDTSVATQISNAIDKVPTFSGDYNDLINAPNITEDDAGNLIIADANNNIIIRSNGDGFETTQINTDILKVNNMPLDEIIDNALQPLVQDDENKSIREIAREEASKVETTGMEYMGEVSSLPTGLTSQDKGKTYKAAQALPGRSLLEVTDYNEADSSGGSFDTQSFNVTSPGWIEVSLNPNDDPEGPPHYFMLYLNGYYYDDDYGDYYTDYSISVESKSLNYDNSVVQFYFTEEMIAYYDHFTFSVGYSYDSTGEDDGRFEGYRVIIDSYSIREVSTVKAGDLIIWMGSAWDVIPSGDDVMETTELKSEIIQEMEDYVDNAILNGAW